MAEQNKKMKVLLVYPEFPNTYWSFKHALPFAGKRSAYPPLGLLTLSSMLPATWEKRLVDMNVRRLRDSDIEGADMVFASAMIVQQDSLREVIDRCKALGKRIAVGGPFVSTGMEHVSGADFLFPVEAELIVPAFVGDSEVAGLQHVHPTDGNADLTTSPIHDLGLV